MRPTYAVSDSGDRALPDAERISKRLERFSRSTSFSKFSNLRVRQSHQMMIVPVRGKTIASSVCQIHCNRSKVEMIRSAARRVVALVTDKHSFWDWTEVELPGEPMGRDILNHNLPADLSLRQEESSIALWISPCGPLPTPITQANTRPKSIFQAGYWWHDGPPLAKRRDAPGLSGRQPLRVATLGALCRSVTRYNLVRPCIGVNP